MAVYDDIFARKSVGGRYRVTERLGRGAFGEVFRAYQDVAGVPGVKFRQVALKLFTRDYVSESNAETVFAEAILLEELAQGARARGEAVHLVTIYDLGVLRDFDGVPYVAMELVPGSLSDVLKRTALAVPLDTAITHLRGICAGVRLAHEHSHTYIHRDLKPDNVLIEANGFLKVADFGLAIDRHTAFMRGGGAGTISYAPPENRTGRVPTPAFDVYSIGVMFLELLTRRNPIADVLNEIGDSRAEVNRVLDSAQHRLAELVDPIGGEPIAARLTELRNAPAVLEVLRRCLAVDPGDRYPNVMALDAALEDIEAGRTPAPRPKQAAPPTETGRQRLERLCAEAKDHLSNGKLDQAAVCITEICTSSPHDERGHFLSATLHERKGNLPDAVQEQKAGVKLMAERNPGRVAAPDQMLRLIGLLKAAGKTSAAAEVEKELARKGGR